MIVESITKGYGSKRVLVGEVGGAARKDIVDFAHAAAKEVAGVTTFGFRIQSAGGDFAVVEIHTS